MHMQEIEQRSSLTQSTCTISSNSLQYWQYQESLETTLKNHIKRNKKNIQQKSFKKVINLESITHTLYLLNILNLQNEHGYKH